ncbi:G-rich RNA sequence binding factor 1 [Operophtera brumata]|uniref:G-rich RNA sequence binding factor 1 n=1 Tax=Operophtera brumata TaxID=104452 RepID=A0A0L7LGK6_OPEBR|nr:G-rich RNA sequence binding factor 1 [Operophtera brumata]
MFLPGLFLNTDGKSRVELLLSYEYQRMWLVERAAWQQRMYPENTTLNVDFVKRYVHTFKANNQPFEKVVSKTHNKRAPGDKAMSYEKDQKKTEGKGK